MRGSSFRPSEPVRTEHPSPPGDELPDDAGQLQSTVPGDRRSALRQGIAWMDGVIPSTGRADENSGALHGGGQRPSGTGSADGGALGTAGGHKRHEGPRFDVFVTPGGYHWWYVDALSDDGAYGLTIIAFIGSVFSPYYAWTHRRDPLNHCAINVALYGPRGARWSMTERGRKSLHCTRDRLGIGPSAIERDGDTWCSTSMKYPHPSRAHQGYDPPDA